jgi:ABC-2 type transport system ATP-binding protein
MAVSKLVALDAIATLQRLPEASPPGTERIQIDTVKTASLLEPVRHMTGVREATIFGRSIHALIDSDHLDALKTQLPEARVQIIEPSLEDVFVTLTNRIMEASQ